MKTIRPIQDQALIEMEEDAHKSEGGIYLSVPIMEALSYGTLRAVAKPLEGAKIGDRVVYNRHAGIRHDIAGKRYVLLKSEYIYGVAE